MQEAKEEFQKYKEAKNTALAKKVKKFPPYNRIRTNRAIGKVQLHDADQTSGPTNMCDCDPKSDQPCSSDADCLNRMMMYECNSSNCKVGDKCCNQRFRKREYIRAKPFNTVQRGWGLRTEEDIKKGMFVIEYVGEIIDDEECNRRLAEKTANNDSNFYFLTIDKDRIIDAGPSGNLARFMNHSCSPNCETQKWVVNGSTRVGLFAVEDIPKGWCPDGRGACSSFAYTCLCLFVCVTIHRNGADVPLQPGLPWPDQDRLHVRRQGLQRIFMSEGNECRLHLTISRLTGHETCTRFALSVRSSFLRPATSAATVCQRDTHVVGDMPSRVSARSSLLTRILVFTLIFSHFIRLSRCSRSPLRPSSGRSCLH